MTTLKMPLLVRYAFLFLLMMLLGAAAAFVWSKRASLLELWYTANEQRYLVMTGEVGPVTYLVYHTDYAALENAAQANEDILGVEMYTFPDVAAMAFTSSDAQSVSRVDQLRGVDKMLRKNIPMICH